MDPAALLERFQGDPYDLGLRRLTRRLSVDRVVLRCFRRAAEDGEPTHLATYGWALGVAPDEVDAAGPLTAAHAYQEAAQGAPDDPAINYAYGLSHAGGFGRRRGLPLDARRGFATAARLDADNAVPHLALAAARLSTGDRQAGAGVLAQALAATRYTPYGSPVAEAVDQAAPWLGASLSELWPERQADATRYLLEHLYADARSARQRNQEPAEPLGRMAAIGRLQIASGPDRPSVLLGGVSAVMMALRGRERVLGEVTAAAARHELTPVVLELLAAQRRLAHDFERATGLTIAVAGGGTLVGLLTAAYGWLRSRRRWPPPWPSALPGRTVAWLGLALAGASVAGVTLPNSAAAARRRAVEARLLRREQMLVRETRTKLLQLLDQSGLA